MAEYKITRVSQEPPKEYEGQHGTTYYIKVMLDGHSKPVSIGKKKPDALKVGDTVYGTITETQYDTDKFTADKMQGGGIYFGNTKSAFQQRPDHHEEIKAQWAIGQAVQLHIAVTANGGEEAQGIEATAKELFDMVDRVKSSEPAKPSLSDQWKQTQVAKQDTPVSNAEVDSLLNSGEEISLSDIPF